MNEQLSNSLLQTGIHVLGLSLAFLGGLVLAYWGLWGNRSKGRPRCPKCWYDMRGSVPKVVCPECGYDARLEHHLYRNRRRWWVIVVGLILILPSAYSLNIMYGLHRERAVIRTLNESKMMNYEFIGPPWLIHRLPFQLRPYLQRADAITLRRNAVPEDLPLIGPLHHLTTLTLMDTSTSDDDLIHLTGLQNLKSLNLAQTQVSDAGLIHIAKLRNVEELWLSYLPVTDQGLVHLKSLKGLKGISLGYTQVTDTGLIHLKRLTNLTSIGLTGTQVTDDGLVYLKACRKLEGLLLSDTQVTDAGMIHLKDLPNLQTLWLHETRVTADGIADLMRSLPNLKVDGP